MLSWAIIEGSVYLIAACLPMMRPIFAAVTPSWLIARLQTAAGNTSTAYHPKSNSKRASAPMLRRSNPRQFSRLRDTPDPHLHLTNVENGVASSDAAVMRVPTADRAAIPMQTLEGKAISKKVDVTVEHVSASPVSPR